MRYTYLPGDVLIIGLFSIRQYGDTPYSCGHIRRETNDIITASAFMQSVLQKRIETEINFGAIAIDDCYSGMNTSAYLTELFTKQSFITDPQTNEIINFDHVVSIVGALSSGVTLYLADMATSLGIPMISYSASSPDLDNKVRYPYFLRTVPSDNLQVRGMIEMLYDLTVTHVGLLYIDDAYGRAGKDALVKEASSRGICVEETIAMTQLMDDAEIESVINQLFVQQVRVVLFFSIDSIARRLLEIINQGEYKRQLIFISSDGWGTNQNLVNGAVGLHSHGSIVFTLDTKAALGQGYKEYLSSLNMTQTELNYWIPNFFEDVHDCDFKTSFEKYSGTICNADQLSTSTTLSSALVDSLYADQRGIHTKMAVHAATEGYKAYCSKTSGCTPALARSNIDHYVQDIKTIEIMNANVFNDNGNGNIAFTIYNIQLKDEGNKYVKVPTSFYRFIYYLSVIRYQLSLVLFLYVWLCVCVCVFKCKDMCFLDYTYSF